VPFLFKTAACCRYEAVTLPENVIDMEVEQRMLFLDSDTAKFRGMVILSIFGFWKLILIVISYHHMNWLFCLLTYVFCVNCLLSHLTEIYSCAAPGGFG
jgi:hypothetical protein